MHILMLPYMPYMAQGIAEVTHNESIFLIWKILFQI